MEGFELDFIRAVIYNRGKFEQDYCEMLKRTAPCMGGFFIVIMFAVVGWSRYNLEE